MSKTTTNEHTTGECTIHVADAPGRPEVFVETSNKEFGPASRVALLRDSDAIELYEQLGEYLRAEGYDV